MPTFSRLPAYALIRLQGPDSVAFAHAQFTNDVSALGVGQWQWSAWLTAKGRVIALFMLYRAAADELLMVLADDDAHYIAEQLRRFVFRRKLVIAPCEELEVAGRFAAPDRASAATAAALGDGATEFDLGALELPRTLRLQHKSTALPSEAESSFPLLWRQADLRLGLPHLEASQREQWTPQQIGLDRLHAYSVKKGCYPGQEIVARTHFLGKAKRLAQLLEVTPGTQPGDDVHQGEQRIGGIVCVAHGLALAVLPIDTGEAALQVAGEIARPLQLIEGLAR